MYWIVVVATLIGITLAAAIGANDVGNSFATAVGSKVLTIRQAVLIASVCEFSGSMLMGAYVSETLRTGIIADFLSVFTPGVDEHMYMLGTMCVLLGSTVWLCLATFLNMPVSTTHSIVGSIVGFVVTFKGYHAIKWKSIGFIALSWVISPLIGLILAGPFSYILSRFVLLAIKRTDSNETESEIDQKSLLRTLFVLPFIVGGTCAVLASTIFVKGSKALLLHKIPWYAGLSGSIVFGLLVGALIGVLTPTLRRRMLRSLETEKPIPPTTKISEMTDACSVGSENVTPVDKSSPLLSPVASSSSMMELDDEQTANMNLEDQNEKVQEIRDEDYHLTPADRVFSSLQILCSALTSFSHGANDVSNAIGPLSAIYMVYSAGSIEAAQKATMPWYILAIGAGGIVLGLALFGKRVIETVGVKLTKNQMRPHQGFVSQLCGASIVMLCSKFGLPVSTTNSIVGAVVGVGLMDRAGSVHTQDSSVDTGSVSWGLLTNIVISWLVTLPISAALTSAFFSFLKYTVLPSLLTTDMS